MLMLTRKRGESITIGDNIVVTVMDIRGGHARIGIHAPSDIPVHRYEVFEAIKQKERRNGHSQEK
jgi:carbon storage regulator